MNSTPLVQSFEFNNYIPEKRIDYRNQLIQQVALTSLKEFAITLASACITSFFCVNSSAMLLFFSMSCGVLIINTLIRSTSAVARYLLFCQEQEGGVDKEDRERLLKLVKLLETMAPMTFSCFDGMTRDTLTHEGGHVLAAYALYKNPHPWVIVDPFKGVATTYYKTSSLTSWGEYFGKDTSRAITAAAGTGLSFSVAIIQLIMAHKLRKSNPQLAKYFLCCSIASIAQSIFYAVSALWSHGSKGHDFVQLASAGIHPLAAAGFLAFLPLLIKGGLALIDYMRETSQPELKAKPQMQINRE